MLASDGAHPERLVTRHRVRVVGWIKHPKRFEPGPWLVVDQPGARFGEALVAVMRIGGAVASDPRA